MSKQKASMCQISNFLHYPCYHKLGCPSLATLFVQRCCTTTRSEEGDAQWHLVPISSCSSNGKITTLISNGLMSTILHEHLSLTWDLFFLFTYLWSLHSNVCSLCLTSSWYCSCRFFFQVWTISVKVKIVINRNDFYSIYWVANCLFFYNSNFQYFFFLIPYFELPFSTRWPPFPHCEKLCFLACRNWTAVCRTS